MKNKNKDVVTEAVKQELKKNPVGTSKRKTKLAIDRKNAKRVVELINSDESIKGTKGVAVIAKDIGIWYNVAMSLVKVLEKEGYINYFNKSIEDVLAKFTSKQKDFLAEAFRAGKKVSNADLIKGAGVSKLSPAMKADISSVLDAGYFTKEKEGRAVYFVPSSTK